MRADSVVAVATRFALRLAADGGWRGTTVALPAGGWTDALTGRAHTVPSGSPGVDAAALLGTWPVALLVRDGG
jgi:(1->4)-alpha-D-glucan 1-alpha-D-glucosylmutase